MTVAKFNRRAESERSASDYLHRMIVHGTHRQADRAVRYIYALEVWLNNNVPVGLEPVHGAPRSSRGAASLGR